MSSSTGLSRTRSLRKAAAGAGAGTGDVHARTTSPSRLPVKPFSTTATAGRAASSATGATAAASRTVRTRLLSGNDVGRAISSRDGTTATVQDPAARIGVSTIRGQAATTARQPSPGDLSRMTSAATRPPSSGGAGGVPSSSTAAVAAAKPRTVTATGHTRAKSSATALTSATTLRPPTSQTSSSGPTPNTITSSRPPLSSANRTQPAHRRQLSQPVAGPTSRAPTTTRPSSRPASRDGAGSQQQPASQGQNGRAAAAAAADGETRLRPAFSTQQQHYSPARNLAPKPLTATYLAPPSPSKLPANVALSAETARLQAELLQLHLLHRDAGAVDAEWRASARRKLGERFASLAVRAEELAAEEAAEADVVNAGALAAWSSAAAARGGRGGRDLDAMVQLLDAVLSGLWSLGEPGGKYARVVRRFEKWAERMADIVEARRRDGEDGLGSGRIDDGGEELLFVGELDAAWKAECAGLVRRLETWRRHLDELGDVPGEEGHGDEAGEQQSSLARVLRGCRTLVHDMLAELDVMEQIEREAMAQEDEWIARVNADDGGENTARAGAIWRVF